MNEAEKFEVVVRRLLPPAPEAAGTRGTRGCRTGSTESPKSTAFWSMSVIAMLQQSELQTPFPGSADSCIC